MITLLSVTRPEAREAKGGGRYGRRTGLSLLPAGYLLVAEREPGTSGSGATFLHEWLMVHDPNSESLLREPLRSGE